MTSIQDSLILQLLVSPQSNIFLYESIDYSQFLFSIFQIDFS